MNFLAHLKSGGSSTAAATSHPRSGAFSHRSAKESVGRRVHADGVSTSRCHDGSSRVGVGTVLVMLQEQPEPSYQPRAKESKAIPRDNFFLAVAAPDCDQALAFLAVQPAGTYVLVRESGDDLAVYVKFQAAVRSFPVAKGKELKRARPNEELVEWGRAYRPLNLPHAEALASQSTVMTPVHRLWLPVEAFRHLERCWLEFLPQVQAIAFELCTQPYYMDEEIAPEHWGTLLLTSRVPCVAFVSADSCGFHLFNTAAIAETADSSALAAAALSVPVRLVEFDVAQCLIAIADGAFRPSAFVAPVHLGTTRYFDAVLGFAAIRDNFLAPERVVLKEVASAGAGSPSAWQDVAASSHSAATASGDAELQLLLAMRAVVAVVVPHEPLPDGLLDALATLHGLWAAQTPAQSRGRWRTPAKIACAAHLLPFYVELFLATAATDGYVARELAAGARPDLLPRLSAALHDDVVLMARRADDASVARLVHHVLQAMALRARVPPALVALVSDLCVESAHFRGLLMRNQGASLLWKAIHTAAALALPALLQPQRSAPQVGELAKRRSSLFGGPRKSRATRRSVAFNASIVLPVAFETTVHVFFRLNPLLVQLELAPALREHHVAAARARPERSAMAQLVRFVERLAFLLLADPSSATWEKDATQLLRMDDLYEHLHREIVLESGDDDAVLECVAALYRLEIQRRRHAAAEMDGKKYWLFFHLLRNPIRAFHERVRELLRAVDATGHESEPDDDHALAPTAFAVLARILPRLPLQLVTEFVLVSLDDLLQDTRILHEYIQRRPQRAALALVRLLVAVLTTVLRRTGDCDLQLLLVRVLASSGSSVPAMLHLLVREVGAELDVLAFVEAFVTLATSLAQRERWHAAHESRDAATLENKSDVEGNEQRKTMLMATVLSPENGVADSDEILWDTVQAICLPLDGAAARLAVVDSFYSRAEFTQRDAQTPLGHDGAQLRALQGYLRVRARVFLSAVLDNARISLAQLRGFLEAHWNALYALRARFQALAPDDAPRGECQALALLHLRCLTALATRRALLPALDEAFLDFRTARELLRILQAGCSLRHGGEQRVGAGGLSLSLDRLSAHAASESALLRATELLVSSPTLHAATLLTVLACAVGEPHALNESLVPRFFIPADVDGSLPDEDLLLSLQRHLRFVDSAELRAALQAGLLAGELDQHFGSPARAHAVRVLVRLLVPDSYDARLYATTGATHIREQHDGDDIDGEQLDLSSAGQTRAYVARGAFAAVYRATPAVGARAVAIKVCSHQKSSGELCVAAEVFNEVVVLERLRGNAAATQLLDFGNNTTESLGFELVLEHCPATLAQWRRSLGDAVGLRSLLSLALAVFLDVGHALAQIHGDRVCHFDIKADNVLLRVEPPALTAELLTLLRQRKGGAHTDATRRVCLGDFGEAAVLAHERGVRLTRTRGTEAIKSPEMLGVSGGDGGDGGYAGPASDVWSLGCLLFELLTEELMFGHDDWAQLYAHVVAAPATTPVVREGHRQKLLQALRPRTDAEKGLALIFVQFLEAVLQRDPLRRPPLDKVLAEADTQLRMIQALPLQPDDDAFEAAALERIREPAAPSPPPPATALALPPHHGAPTPEGPVLGRLFFNLFLVKDALALRAAYARSSGRVLSRPPCASGTIVGDAALRRELSSLELDNEPHIGHYIFFCYDDVKRVGDSAASPQHASDGPEDPSGTFLEIVEGVGRTVFCFNRAQVLGSLRNWPDAKDGAAAASVESSATSARAPPLVRLLLQHSRGILATLQRHLRHQSSRVLLVPADYDDWCTDEHGADDPPLTELTAATLLFFLLAGLGLSPLEALACFSRECGAIVRLPNSHVVQQLLELHEQLEAAKSSAEKLEASVHARQLVRCRCGDKALAASAAPDDASVCFPRPSLDLDAEIVWDCCETRLVQGEAVAASPWRVVDSLRVDRLDSLLRAVLQRQLGPAVVQGGSRRKSQNLLVLRHHHAPDAASALREHVPFLLHGLVERGVVHAESTPWTLYECAMCGVSVCAVGASNDKMALPL